MVLIVQWRQVLVMVVQRPFWVLECGVGPPSSSERLVLPLCVMHPQHIRNSHLPHFPLPLPHPRRPHPRALHLQPHHQQPLHPHPHHQQQQQQQQQLAYQIATRGGGAYVAGGTQRQGRW